MGSPFCSAGPNNKNAGVRVCCGQCEKDSGFEMMKRNSEFQEKNNLYLSSSYGKIESVSVENQFSGGYEVRKFRMCKQRKAIFRRLPDFA